MYSIQVNQCRECKAYKEYSFSNTCCETGMDIVVFESLFAHIDVIFEDSDD